MTAAMNTASLGMPASETSGRAGQPAMAYRQRGRPAIGMLWRSEMWGDYLDIVRAQWHFFTHWWWVEMLVVSAVTFVAWMWTDA